MSTNIKCSKNKKSTKISTPIMTNKQINIKKRTNQCIEKNCLKGSSFNLPTEIKPSYCSDHKKENMIDVKSKRCFESNC